MNYELIMLHNYNCVPISVMQQAKSNSTVLRCASRPASITSENVTRQIIINLTRCGQWKLLAFSENVYRYVWCVNYLGRSTYMTTCRRTYILPGFFFFFLLSSFFFSPRALWARWTELNQNRPHGRKWVRFENACPKSGVSLPPTNWGPKNQLFGRLRNSMATLTAYIFQT